MSHEKNVIVVGSSNKKKKNREKEGIVIPDSITTNITKDYQILQVLGEGAFGQVKRGVHKKKKNEVAIKCCLKKENEDQDLIQEIDMLRRVQGHEGIVKLYGVYESRSKVNIVMELISGGELFDRIVELAFYSEKDAAGLVKQIVEAVSYCHKLDIVHRDLKPENLMFTSRDSSVLKLIDFGIAINLPEDSFTTEVVGTPTYMAPEIDKRVGYGKPADVYSIGVIMYILLCGYPPFDIEEGIIELDFPGRDWSSVSQEAVALITQLLDPDPYQRLTIEELKNHKWVSGLEVPAVAIGNDVINTMRAFNTLRKSDLDGGSTYVGGGKRQQRVSVFGMFGLENDKTAIRMARGGEALPYEDLAKRIESDSIFHRSTFREICSNMGKISAQAPPEISRALLDKTEEMSRISAAFNDLVVDFLKICKMEDPIS